MCARVAIGCPGCERIPVVFLSVSLLRSDRVLLSASLVVVNHVQQHAEIPVAKPPCVAPHIDAEGPVVKIVQLRNVDVGDDGREEAQNEMIPMAQNR